MTVPGHRNDPPGSRLRCPLQYYREERLCSLGGSPTAGAGYKLRSLPVLHQTRRALRVQDHRHGRS